MSTTACLRSAAGNLFNRQPSGCRMCAITTAATLTVHAGAVSDFDGDGLADLTVWRPGDGTWYSLLSSNGYSANGARGVQWGSADAGDVPLLGDLDGDS